MGLNAFCHRALQVFAVVWCVCVDSIGPNQRPLARVGPNVSRPERAWIPGSFVCQNDAERESSHTVRSAPSTGGSAEREREGGGGGGDRKQTTNPGQPWSESKLIDCVVLEGIGRARDRKKKTEGRGVCLLPTSLIFNSFRNTVATKGAPPIELIVLVLIVSLGNHLHR